MNYKNFKEIDEAKEIRDAITKAFEKGLILKGNDEEIESLENLIQWYYNFVQISEAKIGNRVRCINHETYALPDDEGEIVSINTPQVGKVIVRWDKSVGGWSNSKLKIAHGCGEVISFKNIELL